jgi:hypothetical protein
MKSGNVSFDLKRFVGIKRDYSKEDVEKLKGTQNEFGRNALAVYLGNPNAHNLGNAMFLLSNKIFKIFNYSYARLSGFSCFC